MFIEIRMEKRLSISLYTPEQILMSAKKEYVTPAQEPHVKTQKDRISVIALLDSGLTLMETHVWVSWVYLYKKCEKKIEF